MQTHRDADHELNPRQEAEREKELEEAMRDLEEKAEEMTALRQSTITAGDEDEEALREWASNKVFVRELPERETDERLDLSRISVGSIPGGMGYVVFRGPLAEVKLALRRALNALREAPDG